MSVPFQINSQEKMEDMKILTIPKQYTIAL